MKRLFLLGIFLVICFLNVAAQPIHYIKGVVIDKMTRKPLEFVNILVQGTGSGSVTDETGSFTSPCSIERIAIICLSIDSFLYAK